jgi:hypothetical protein
VRRSSASQKSSQSLFWGKNVSNYGHWTIVILAAFSSTEEYQTKMDSLERLINPDIHEKE